MFLLRVENNKFDCCFNPYGGDKSLVFYEKVNKDSIDLISILKKPDISNENCIIKYNIDWFPPYMKRVRKIDYKKFNLPDIKVKYLKNPDKAPKYNY